MRIGYACINTTLAERDIVVNRSIIKKTFQTKGIAYASQLALKNIQDFAKVIDWNIKNGILLYRMSSDMFPWMSEYEITDLPDFEKIKLILNAAGRKAAVASLRLTFHPGPFNVLASNNDLVVSKTIKELRQHAEIMDLIGLPLSPFAKINIHVGGAYGDKPSALERFAENFQKLPDNVKSRLTIENDDKANMFSVSDLGYLHLQTRMPIVFDYLHHKFCNGNLTEEEAFLAALETWPIDVTPVVHFSSSKKAFEDKSAVEAAHADFVYQHIPTYGKQVDIMLEAKAKELAIIKYLKDYKRSGKTVLNS
jgi:UV DNA damage endonuclease